MIFSSRKFITWDTWVYYCDGTYYAYYLITDRTPGEGFGVAVSQDGVHFTDKGQCIAASDKMVFYLGTGAVWKSPSFETDRRFICNYSEWRKDESGANVQNILFAHSYDLIHWEKYGDARTFSVDETYYKKYELEGGRWDCIFPYVENGRYHGLFTATPKDYLGCGYATSADGVSWTAQKPPEFEIADKGIRVGIELGAVCKHGDTFYLLMGTYVNEYGIGVLTCDTINGKYVPQKKNFALLANNSFRHAYFMRFFEKDGELLVNHHCISRIENEYGRPTTYLSPFKKVDFDEEGILRLKWFEGNDLLKGAQTSRLCQNGTFIEGRLEKTLTILLESGTLSITVDRARGSLETAENGRVTERINKDVAFGQGCFTLLIRGEFIELYLDGWFVAAYTLPAKAVNVSSDRECFLYEMNV